MGEDEKFVVVRELYPESKGGFFKTKKCPPVDDSREFAYCMDSKGGVARLAGAGERDAAAKAGARIFAVAKRHVAFSTVVLRVCREDGYEWNYALDGEIRIADPAKFLAAWARDEGACGLDGIDSARFSHRVCKMLDTVVRDAIAECRRTSGYSIADIEEKDALPAAFWENAFANASSPLLEGLGVAVADNSFISPSRELEESMAAAAAAQQVLESNAQREYMAAVEGKKAEAELAELERRRIRAELDFKLEVAQKEAALQKCQAEAIRFQLGNLRNDKNAIADAMCKAGADSAAKEALAAAFSEADGKMKALSQKLEKLGGDVGGTAAASGIDPVVTPHYHGMSDKFLYVVQNLKSVSADGIEMSLEAARQADGYETRDLMPARRRRDDAVAKDGVLHLGDRMTLRLKSSRPGYLTLFNFGTSGAVSKIFPHPAFGTADNRIEAGRVYMLPGELMPEEFLPDGVWEEQGPVSEANGLRETVVAVLTDEKLDLDAECFGVETKKFIARGGFDAVEESISSLLDLPKGSWTWGAISATVEE